MHAVPRAAVPAPVLPPVVHAVARPALRTLALLLPVLALAPIVRSSVFSAKPIILWQGLVRALLADDNGLLSCTLPLCRLLV